MLAGERRLARAGVAGAGPPLVVGLLLGEEPPLVVAPPLEVEPPLEVASRVRGDSAEGEEAGRRGRA